MLQKHNQLVSLMVGNRHNTITKINKCSWQHSLGKRQNQNNTKHIVWKLALSPEMWSEILYKEFDTENPAEKAGVR